MRAVAGAVGGRGGGGGVLEVLEGVVGGDEYGGEEGLCDEAGEETGGCGEACAGRGWEGEERGWGWGVGHGRGEGEPGGARGGDLYSRMGCAAQRGVCEWVGGLGTRRGLGVRVGRWGLEMARACLGAGGVASGTG
ncbi:hypothetical protein K439DRAFT_1619180 [Ramaria rubella]|nr:hypothetical protein K439DRAFT_1619180 [Ramaria rubella]